MNRVFKSSFEKTALTITNRYNRYAKSIAAGSLIGSAIGATLGAEYKSELPKEDREDSNAVPVMAAIGGLVGGVFGAKLKSKILEDKLKKLKKEKLFKSRIRQSRKQYEESQKAWEEFEQSFKRRRNDNSSNSNFGGNSRSSGNSGSSGSSGFGGNSRSSGSSGFGGNTDHIDHLKTFGINSTDIKTKDDLKKVFKNLALKNHPDRGGDVKKMQEINSAFDKIKKTSWFDKLAFFRGFNGTKK